MAHVTETTDLHVPAPADQVQPIRRGAQSRLPLKTAIIGGGKSCADLLALLSDERLTHLKMEILGVADPNPAAPGISRAKELGLFTTGDFSELYNLPGLNLVMELTGSLAVREQVIRTIPLQVTFIDHRGARLLWDLIQMEIEKQSLQVESEKKLRQFLESAHDVIIIKDLEGRYLYVNPAGSLSTGLSREQVIGHTDFELFPEAQARAMSESHQEVVRERKTRFSKDRMHIGGEVRQYDTVRFPIFNEQGDMDSLAIISRDVTEEMALQEELRRNKEYLENILSNSYDMIITTDTAGRIVTVNPAAERMLGYSRDEMIGVRVENFWQETERRREIIRQVETLGAVTNAPATLVAKEGRLVEISLSISLLRDAQGRVLGTVGISKDVTEENRLRKQLLEQERLAAVGQTVASVTHCMKNVLNGLKGGSYMVEVGLKRNDPKLTREGWETVQEGVDRISKISLNMLSYCRDRKPVPVAVSPYQLARDTVELVEKSARQQGVTLTCRGAEDEIVHLDPDAVGRALLNLVTNAVEACKEKTYGPGESPRVDVRVERAEGGIRFTVRDNGVGMDQEVREQLFKRFFSTKSYQGTGLGLSTTAKIVAEHGGTIAVDSESGKGSTFTVFIPSEPQRTEGETCRP
ncbi:MAG: PAS domain S-box protein [Desulfobacterota bacterium]|nr:PAS domain S-box protein [Thermodesulfobacteriota bacterium]